MRMKAETAVRHTGQSLSCCAALQSEQSTRWPQGMAAWVAGMDMHIWHSGSELTGGAEGAVLSSWAMSGEGGGGAAGGAGARWQLKLWLPSHWHCRQQ